VPDNSDEIAALKARLAELERASTVEAPKDHLAQPNTSKVGVVVGLVVAGVIGVMIWAASKPSTPSTENAETTIAQNETVVAQADALVEEEREPVSSWSYTEDKDEMTDRVTRTACVVSTNQVMLDWPYGNVRAELCLRNSPRFGRDAYVRLLGDGQVLCRSYDGCTVSVRFDDKTAQRYSAVTASDGSSNIFFITNRSRLEGGLLGANLTRVAAEFYQAGVQTMEFDTAGLQANLTAPALSTEEVSGATSSSSTASVSSDPPVRIVVPATIPDPKWVRMPRAEDVARYYPAAAKGNRSAGKATINCTVSRAGVMYNCWIVSEDPVGMGFGAAALKLARYYVASPKTVGGATVEDNFVRIAVAFKPPT
jgi:TonB family protein